MAAVAASQVSIYPSAGPSATAVAPPWWFCAGKEQRQIVARKMKVTGVTAADTITPTVLGLSAILDVGAGYAVGATSLSIGLDPTANTNAGGIIIGSGPSNETIYFTVYGVVLPATASTY